MSVIFVYAKYGQIKVLGLEDSRAKHDELIREGWEHTQTIDPCVFIQYLHNGAENEDVIDEIRMLSRKI